MVVFWVLYRIALSQDLVVGFTLIARIVYTPHSLIIIITVKGDKVKGKDKLKSITKPKIKLSLIPHTK